MFFNALELGGISQYYLALASMEEDGETVSSMCRDPQILEILYGGISKMRLQFGERPEILQSLRTVEDLLGEPRTS